MTKKSSYVRDVTMHYDKHKQHILYYTYTKITQQHTYTQRPHISLTSINHVKIISPLLYDMFPPTLIPLCLTGPAEFN